MLQGPLKLVQKNYSEKIIGYPSAFNGPLIGFIQGVSTRDPTSIHS